MLLGKAKFWCCLFVFACKQEAVKRISSWQYTNCIDLWVSFISANKQDYDLQPLLYMIIQIINGVAVLFPGPRYLPLRLECIQWLNNLSTASGVFIPVASFALDILEYKTGKDNGKPGKDFNFYLSVKVRDWSSSLLWIEMSLGPWAQDLCISAITNVDVFGAVAKTLVKISKLSGKVCFFCHWITRNALCSMEL